MISQTEHIIDTQIRPICKPLTQTSLSNIHLLIQETRSVMSLRQFEAHLPQWTTLAKKLNSNDKLTYLAQQNCRQLLIHLIREDAMHLFNSSYLNRAKIDNEYIRYLKELGPYFFIEVIMVVSKLKTIHKHFYHKLVKNVHENHLILKIIRILELCNQKKRSVNNNKAKFLCIVEDENDRLEITKELGKMLRQAWKRQKSKDFELQEEEPRMEQAKIEKWMEGEQMKWGEEGGMKWSEVAMREYGKEMVKQPSIGYQEEYNFDLSEQLMSFQNMPQNTYRYSDNSEVLI